MIDQSASGYFATLAELRWNVHATDLHGTVLSLDEGAKKAADLILCSQPFPMTTGTGACSSGWSSCRQPPGDLLRAINSSGQSENILRAVRRPAARGCEIIALSGFGPDNPRLLWQFPDW